MSEWAWVYLGLAGLGDMMVEVPSSAAELLFSGTLIQSFTARHFTTVKVRKETRDEMAARTKAYKVEVPIQETIIETFPWIVEQEKAIVGDGIIFMHSVAWARRPCDDLIEAAKKLWSANRIIEVKCS